MVLLNHALQFLECLYLCYFLANKHDNILKQYLQPANRPLLKSIGLVFREIDYHDHQFFHENLF